jgi:hypothetical protein
MDIMLGKTYYGRYSEIRTVDPLYRLRPPSHPHNDHIATFLSSMLDNLMPSKAKTPYSAPVNLRITDTQSSPTPSLLFRHKFRNERGVANYSVEHYEFPGGLEIHDAPCTGYFADAS